MRVLDIFEGTTVDGTGLRTSIYFAGCAHACPGCHNPQSWDMMGGREMSQEEILAVVDEAGFNVTFSGGDPLYQLDELLELADKIHQRGLNIWCYTGFTLEELMADERLKKILDAVDVIVEGPFIMAKRDKTLRFRGSSNQRVVKVGKGNTPVVVDIDKI